MEKRWKLLVSMLIAAVFCVCLSPIGAFRANAATNTTINVSGNYYAGSSKVASVDGLYGYVQVNDNAADKAVVTLFNSTLKNTANGPALEIISTKNIEVIVDGSANIAGDLIIRTLNSQDQCDYSKKITIRSKTGDDKTDNLQVFGQLRAMTGELHIASGMVSVGGGKTYNRPENPALNCSGALTIGDRKSNGSSTGPTMFVGQNREANVGINCRSFKISGGEVTTLANKVGLVAFSDVSDRISPFVAEGGYIRMDGSQACTMVQKYETNSAEAITFQNRIGAMYGSSREVYIVSTSSNYGSRGSSFKIYSFASTTRRLSVSGTDYSSASFTSGGLENVACKRLSTRVTFKVPEGLWLPFDFWDYETEKAYGLFPTPTVGENNREVAPWKDRSNNKILREGDSVSAVDITASTSFTEIDPPKFKDVPINVWYAKPAYYCSTRGLITGTGDGTTFAPVANVTRGMIVTILYRLEGSPDVSGSYNPFPDVPNNAWFRDAVLWAKDSGVVTGYENGTFGPGKNATREQVATIMKRYAEYRGFYNSLEKVQLGGFPDGKNVSSWAKDAMAWAVGMGILTGKETAGQAPKLAPQGTAVRAEFATILMRYLSKYEMTQTYFMGDEFYLDIPNNWYNNVDVHVMEDQYSKYMEFRSKAFVKAGKNGRLFKLRFMTQAEYSANPSKYEYVGVLVDNTNSSIPYYIAAEFYPYGNDASHENDLWNIYDAMMTGFRQFEIDSYKYHFSKGKG